MKNDNDKKERRRSYFQVLSIVIIGVGLYWGLTNYKVVEHWLSVFSGILMSFMIGVVIALILNVPMSFIERNLFPPERKGKKQGRLAKKLSRPVSLILTYIFCIAVIAAVLCLVIPSVKENVMQLYEQIPSFVNRVFELAESNPTLYKRISESGLSSETVINTVVEKLKDSSLIKNTLTGTISFASGMVTGLVNFIIGLIFSVYLLSQKSKLKDQLYRICSAYFPEKITAKLAHIGNLSKRTFSSFISGQGLEACILGTLCAVGMKIFGFPYAGTIGVLVGVTAFIPIVGAFIGIAIGTFLIMITSLKQAIFFVIFMVVLQQIEGNLIYPRVVGSSVGLPSLWVLFAITVGGNIGGIFGMFVAVPVFSVLYCLIGDSVNERNKIKREKAEAEKASAAQDEELPDWIK